MEDKALLGPERTAVTPSAATISNRTKMTMVIVVVILVVAVGALVAIVVTHPALPENVINARETALGYELLEVLCDTIGHRLGGSQALDDAIQFMEECAHQTGFHRVIKQPATIQVWKRNSEYLKFRGQMIPMLGLGGSIGTNGTDLTASTVVLKNFDDLATIDVVDKIVVFNHAWDVSYGRTVPYRRDAATEAARYGAAAVVTRSITPISLQTPHTGGMSYNKSVNRIPIAAITVEYAELFDRLVNDHEQEVELSLYMEATGDSEPDATSYNIIADIVGTEKPEEIILVGGHIDSWDVGQGAQDDGGGLLATFSAAAIFLNSTVKPKRTIRWVAFTDEEYSGGGADAYFASLNATEVANHVLAIESDIGVFSPIGFTVAPTQEVMNAFTGINARINPDFSQTFFRPGGVGTDIDPLTQAGVPSLGLVSSSGSNPEYFRLHHTEADTFDKVEKSQMQQCQQVLAAVIQRFAFDSELYLR